jgi:hypothetical protein
MTFDINKADIIDTSHVDMALASIRRNEENARRRALLLTWGKTILLGGVGVAAVIAAASLWLMHPRVIETTKIVEKPVIIEKPVIVGDAKPNPLVEAPLPPVKPVEQKLQSAGVCEGMHFPATVVVGASAWRCDGIGHGTLVDQSTPPLPPDPTKWFDPTLVQRDFNGRPLYTPPAKLLPPPQPAPTTETHPWDKLADKQYVGIITDVIDGKVCVDHDTAPHHCIENVVVNPTAHQAMLEDGHDIPDPNSDLSPMVKWIGYRLQGRQPSRPEASRKLLGGRQRHPDRVRGRAQGR